jgi:acetyl-CoA carboxylase carboxyltransferase component
MEKDLERLRKLNSFAESETVNPDKTGEKFSPRERLALLFDNGEYKELFKFANSSTKGNTFKDGLVCGTGMINNRPAVAYASEFDIQGGSVGSLQADQISELYRLARQSGIPVIALSESAGARISDSVHIMEGFSKVMKEAVFCSGVIPQITCALGYCIGASAFVATLNDFIIMNEKATLSISGASVNKAATGEDVTEEQLGGTEIHTRYSGLAHFTEKSEKKSIARVRQLLEYLPSNNLEPPPVMECFDSETREEPTVEKLLPDDTDTPFDMMKLVKLFVDDHKFLELQAAFAPNMIIGFARFAGIPVGIAANQSMHLAGALDSNAFKKMARFVNFLSAFNFPLITFVDVPGAIPTLEENKNGILIHGAQLIQAMGHLKSLKISIVVRRCFGGAYCMLNPKISGGDIIYAYPGAMVGVMSDKAMSSVFKRDTKMSEKIEAMHARGERFDDPFIAASFGYLDDIIFPAQTRVEIIRALKIFGNKRFLDLPPKWMNNPAI